MIMKKYKKLVIKKTNKIDIIKNITIKKYKKSVIKKKTNKIDMIKIKKCGGRFILWFRPLLLLRSFLLHFPRLSLRLHFPHFLRLQFVTANNRYWPGYLGQHMPSSEHLGADEHQMKIYHHNFELWLTGPIVM